MGVSADGTVALVLAPAPGTDGSEGRPEDLFAVPLAGGPRRPVDPDGDRRLAGGPVRQRNGAEVAIVSSCEEFFAGLHLATEGVGGTLSGIRELELKPVPEGAPRLSWSVDGKALIGTVGGRVVRVDPTTGVVETLEDGLGAIKAEERSDGTLVVLTNGRLLVGSEPVAVQGFDFAVRPGGQDVAVWGDRGLSIVGGGQSTRRVATGLVRGAAWSPDGGTLAYAREGRLHRETADGGSPVAVDVEGVLDPIFSPDGRTLVVTSYAGGAVGLTEPVVKALAL